MNRQHSGRIGQTLIYIGKLFRMFIFRNDWKLIPMAAVITAVVSYVVSDTLFKTMEGTLTGTFALSCICIWNGFFNSIQVVCRERPIIKREHRSGLHMSSYILAHMVYQAFLCICQSVIVMVVLGISDVTFPAKGYMTGNVHIDLTITLFLTSYAADMMALFVSSIARNSTTAMTVMPFLMIFQLMFSGGFFSLKGLALDATEFTVSKWALTAMCAQGEYNSLPNRVILDSITTMDIDTNETPDMDVAAGFIGETANGGTDGLSESSGGMEGLSAASLSGEDSEMILTKMREYLSVEENREKFAEWCGQKSYDPRFETSQAKIWDCWFTIGMFAVVFAGLSVISLEFIDRDKR